MPNHGTACRERGNNFFSFTMYNEMSKTETGFIPKRAIFFWGGGCGWQNGLNLDKSPFCQFSLLFPIFPYLNPPPPSFLFLEGEGLGICRFSPYATFRAHTQQKSSTFRRRKYFVQKSLFEEKNYVNIFF